MTDLTDRPRYRVRALREAVGTERADSVAASSMPDWYRRFAPGGAADERVVDFRNRMVGSGLSPFMHLPPPAPRSIVRARMASLIEDCVSARGCITEAELRANFSDQEIADHFHDAKRIARVDRAA